MTIYTKRNPPKIPPKHSGLGIIVKDICPHPPLRDFFVTQIDTKLYKMKVFVRRV